MTLFKKPLLLNVSLSVIIVDTKFVKLTVTFESILTRILYVVDINSLLSCSNFKMYY